jgi:hypothetical protein
MDALFFVYGDQFVTLDRSQDKIRELENRFDELIRERKELLKGLRNKDLSHKERYEFKWKLELNAVRLKHVKGDLYILEGRS